jgi:hypothetical protein
MAEYDSFRHSKWDVSNTLYLWQNIGKNWLFCCKSSRLGSFRSNEKNYQNLF